MRVLHVVPTYLPARRYGGTIFAVHGLCKALTKRGHEVSVFTTNVDGKVDSNVPIDQLVDIEGVGVWYFPSRFLRRLHYSPMMEKALNKRIKNFDLLHLHSIYVWPTWAAAKKARNLRIPYIMTPHGMLIKELIKKKQRLLKSMWIHLIERRNLENASAIHATSELEAQEIKRFNFKLPPISVVPNGVDLDTLEYSAVKAPVSRNIQLLKEKKPFILFLGRVNWKKGLDRLISALPFLTGIHLIIAGSDEKNYQCFIERLAEKFGVRDQTTFTGAVYDADKLYLLKEASAFVLPSYSENFGISVLEAMAVGCPVVVTPEVGLAEIVEKTNAGLVVEGDPKALGEAIAKLLAHPEERQQMGVLGQKAARDHFTWDLVAKKMESLYRQILSQ